MRLLNVIGSMDPVTGGPCQVVRDYANTLTQSGHEVEVVSLDEPRSEFISQSSIPISAIGKRRGVWGYHPDLLPWFLEHLQRFDAVLLHGLWLYPGFALRQAARRLISTAPRYYVMPHGMLDPWFQRSRPIKGLRNTIYWKLIEHRVVRDARALLFTCEEEMVLARGTFRPYRPSEQIVVGLGTTDPKGDAQSLANRFRSRYPQIGGRTFLLFLGRIHPKKGVEILIRAYASSIDKVSRDARRGGALNGWPSVPSLVIAGPASDGTYLSSLKQLAARLGLECRDERSSLSSHDGIPSITWLPMLTGDDKWGAFNACDAFVLPSHQENFGIAVTEALACRKSVLISDKVNIWREIQAEGAGLIAPDTEEGFAALLNEWIYTSSASKGEMARRARQCFERRFEASKATRMLVDAIEMSAE